MRWLATREVALVGVDAPSVDAQSVDASAAYRGRSGDELLAEGVAIVVNLNLAALDLASATPRELVVTPGDPDAGDETHRVPARVVARLVGGRGIA